MPHPPSMPDAPNNFVQQLLAARSGSPDALAWLLENYRTYLLRIANEELDADLRPAPMPGEHTRAICAEILQMPAREIDELIAAGAREITLDLTDVQMLDSRGIGLLIAAHNTLLKKGGRLTVVHASPEILELLRTMRIHQHFSVSGS